MLGATSRATRVELCAGDRPFLPLSIITPRIPAKDTVTNAERNEIDELFIDPGDGELLGLEREANFPRAKRARTATSPDKAEGEPGHKKQKGNAHEARGLGWGWLLAKKAAENSDLATMRKHLAGADKEMRGVVTEHLRYWNAMSRDDWKSFETFKAALEAAHAPIPEREEDLRELYNVQYAAREEMGCFGPVARHMPAFGDQAIFGQNWWDEEDVEDIIGGEF